ncbi:rhomboid family intramembrane serine protease [Aquisalimonas sp.]|uniref:rhomboid family intramembrane serine protease n=1 Tax=Aquisalimonas sp. TaxID=1872621 RepID=UPI0025C7349E|nr:rhomboid family intramembrane serine protease [Aquisalimonas sp.]
MTITLLLIAVTVAVSFLAWQQPSLFHTLIHWPPGVQRGEWWRLITHGFIHADTTHLLFNMITLFFFGRVMEQVLVPHIGTLGFVLFYIAGIMIAALPSQYRHRHDVAYRSLGASGAVAAVLFAYILIQPWAMLLVFVIPVPAIVFALVYVTYSFWAERRAQDNINHSAHLWGAAWGVVFMIGLEPALVPHFLQELLSPL